MKTLWFFLLLFRSDPFLLFLDFMSALINYDGNAKQQRDVYDSSEQIRGESPQLQKYNVCIWRTVHNSHGWQSHLTNVSKY